MKYHILYKITNIINNKIYIGMHSTYNINDNYMGSGLNIIAAIKKHGSVNFKKDILEVFESREEAYLAESLIVDNDFLSRDDVYNIIPGGNRGVDMSDKISAIDVVTKESVGSVSIKHPKVISKDWVHHSTGKISVTNINTGERLYINTLIYDKSIHKLNGPRQDGKNNGNYKEPSEEFLKHLYACIPYAIENKYLKKQIFIRMIGDISESYYHKRISEVWVNNHLGGIYNVIERYNKRFNTNYIYDPYYRGFASYKKLKENTFTWYTDGVKNIQIKPNQNIPQNFYKGRITV